MISKGMSLVWNWINLIINLSMFQKTQMSEVSTNAEPKVTTSFFTSCNRQMFGNNEKNNREVNPNSPLKNSKANPYNDLLIFTPSIISTVSWPELYLIDGEITVVVKGNFYEIGGLRGNKKFVPRGSEINSELVFFWAEKPTKKINLITVQRYLKSLKNEKELWLHINVSKFDPESYAFQSSDFHLCCERQVEKGKRREVLDFCSLQLIDNCKRGIMVMKILGQQRNINYKCLLLDLFQKVGTLEVNSFQKKKNIIQAMFMLDLNFSEHLGRQQEKIIKTTKSEFGDIVLLVTNLDIYEIQLEDMGEGIKLNVKEYKVFRSIISAKGNMKSRKESESSYNSFIEEILDVRFMSNGLKVMILSSLGELYLMEASNFLASHNIKDLMTSAQLSDKYFTESFVFNRFYPVNGTIALEFHSDNNINLLKKADQNCQTAHLNQLKKGLIILKLQGTNFSCSKLINLLLDPKQLIYFSLRECEAIDEMILQYISKKKPEMVEVYKCRILVHQINSLAKICENYYNYSKRIDYSKHNHKLTHYHPHEEEKLYLSVEVPKVSRIFYLLREKELTCYKFFSDLDCEKANKEYSCLFTHSFFEKCQKITVNPLTMQFALVFKEFVKFFYFDYYQIKILYTLKLKNVSEVRYVGSGQKIVVTTSEGFIYLLDTYRFSQTKLMEFYGEVSQVHIVDERLLLIKSTKNVLHFFEMQLEDLNEEGFKKRYEIKLQEKDLYLVDDRQVIVFRQKAILEVYTHTPQTIPKDMTEAEQECFLKLKNIHPHLSRQTKCLSFEEQIPSTILLSQQLGFFFVATSKGNVKQYLWPLQLPTNPNPPEVFVQQVSSHSILSLSIDAKLTHLYVVCSNGVINQFEIKQFINGEQMPYVYSFAQKTRNKEIQKRQLVDRTYFIDSYTPTEITMTENRSQIIGELQFFIDKLKDDFEEMTKSLVNRGKMQEKELKTEVKDEDKRFKVNAKQVEEVYKGQRGKIQNMIQQQKIDFQEEKAKEQQKYQKSLLILYKESDRLKGILKSQDEKMTKEQDEFRQEFDQRMQQLKKQMNQEQQRLENEYKDIHEKRRLANLQNEIENQEEDEQMQLFKATIHRQEQQQLEDAEDTKEHLLGENAKKEKQINNLKNRSNNFENLILETKVQITELRKDQEQYNKKKQYLQQQLKDKEQIIQRIEHQLVQYLKNTEDMKTIKNNHEYQLEEYEKEVCPITDNHLKIQNNVKQMNMQIMKEYNEKKQRNEIIQELTKNVEKLKEKKKTSVAKKMETGGKLNRILQRIVYLATHSFDDNIKHQLLKLIDEKEGEYFSRNDEDKEKQRKNGEKIVRYKNVLRREIQEEEKREEHIIKNPHQYFRHHKENTALVRQYNELKKTQQVLKFRQEKLLNDIRQAKAALFHTPLRRNSSLSLHKPVEKKLTPYQRYQEQQATLIRKQQETSETKLSRASQSVSFLKGLMKEMGQSESKYEKMEVMRERVRTFVNPEMKGKIARPEEIKKILFGRSRRTSEILKLQ